MNDIYGTVDTSEFKLDMQSHLHLNWVFDLETLATKRNAIVTEISAVGFEIETGNIVSEMTYHLSVDEQVRLGRAVSSGTLAFWLQQDIEARTKLLSSMDEHCQRNQLPLPQNPIAALAKLHNGILDASKTWASLDKENRKEEPLVWGNGISFDLGKVTDLYETFERNVPWQYWAERDARTLVDLMPGVKAKINKDFQGIPHFGLDDCKHEIRYLSAIYSYLHDLQLAGY